MALHLSFCPACSHPACILSSTDPLFLLLLRRAGWQGWLRTLGLQLQWLEPGRLRTMIQSSSLWGPGALTQLNVVRGPPHPELQAEAGVGAVKHNNVHSVEREGSCASQHAPLWTGLGLPRGVCPLLKADSSGGARRFSPFRGGLSDSALCKFSSELLPQVPLFCESEELVQLCFLNHLISTLRPTPRWGRPLHLLAKRLGLQAGHWPVVSLVCAIY